MRVRVRLHGVIKTAAGVGELDIHLHAQATVRQLVRELVNTVARDEFERYLIDADLKDPRPNALIMISGTEVGALNGLETTLRDGDEAVFLPVAHGGARRIVSRRRISKSTHMVYISPHRR